MTGVQASTVGTVSDLAFDSMVPCSLDPARAAEAYCTSCLRPFSGDFLGIRNDGRAICHPCAVRESVAVTSFRVPGSPSGDPALVGGWPRAVAGILVHPLRTFAARYDGPVGPALVFGFLATWIGFLATTGWNLVFHGDALVEFITTTTPMVADVDHATIRRVLWFGTPVVAAARMAIGIVLLHLGTLATAGPQSATLRASARVFALTSGTLVLCVIPVIGPFLGLVTWFTAAMAYLQSHYDMRMLRRLLAVLPTFLMIAAIGPSTFVPP